MVFVKGKIGVPDDKIMTPRHIAKKIIDMFYTGGSVLDPFKGEGAFFDQLPFMDKRWAEIDDGVDFFDIDGHFDWIISNPPYSIYEEVMEHSYKIADNIVYLIPVAKLVSSMNRIWELGEYGGVKKIWFIGTGNSCGFPFGFPVCAVHIKRGYKGNIETILEPESEEHKNKRFRRSKKMKDKRKVLL